MWFKVGDWVVPHSPETFWRLALRKFQQNGALLLKPSESCPATIGFWQESSFLTWSKFKDLGLYLIYPIVFYLPRSGERLDMAEILLTRLLNLNLNTNWKGALYCLCRQQRPRSDYLQNHWILSHMSRQHSFAEIWSGNIFCRHSLPNADSKRAIVSFWRKNAHNNG